jgi:hypothetical protein
MQVQEEGLPSVRRDPVDRLIDGLFSARVAAAQIVPDEGRDVAKLVEFGREGGAGPRPRVRRHRHGPVAGGGEGTWQRDALGIGDAEEVPGVGNRDARAVWEERGGEVTRGQQRRQRGERIRPLRVVAEEDRAAGGEPVNLGRRFARIAVRREAVRPRRVQKHENDGGPPRAARLT